MKPLLITMPHSHYAEKARWGMDLTGIDYEEESHPPLFHLFATKKRGGRSVPVLVHDGKSYTDSTDILIHLDDIGTKLYPTQAELRTEALALEETFDQSLGPHSRRWAYAQLLPHSALLLKVMSPGAGRVERALLPWILPIVKQVIKKAFRITDQSAIRSLGIVDQVFSDVGQRLQHENAYLVGDRFTAADLTFAALAAPVLLPPQYRSHMPALEELPDNARSEVLRLRNTIAGKYALRLFREHRQSLGPAG
jgi:glutathione S-transferase